MKTFSLQEYRKQAEVCRDQQCPENFEYKGHIFSTWKEFMDDNVKIYHEIKTPKGEVKSMPWSPYDMPSVDEVKMFIDLGCPRGAEEREFVGGCRVLIGNFNSEILRAAYKSKFGMENYE